ncbi:ATP-grasp domain-containing protein [Streptomyces sp. NBC_00335]|uniref:ATP-grasp domain-containing protein n=1 Tax=unclassified Streptomyces TaxID=2593676 RepID=UPI0022589EB2|nr:MULTISPECIES: ATP-grasp domain-containing protein [unclassified Streptomyces]MCX5406822.1 ATP-grasp domain-containing protein [Streptomyces sp. NBC_00086]
MKNKETVCVIVDAYSSGALLPAAFHAYGLPTVHVRNRVEEYAPWAHPERAAGVIEVIDFHGDYEGVTARLDSYHVAHVVSGLESGVYVADHLAHLLGVPTGNGIELTAAKREKAAMVEVVRNAGIRHARSAQVTTAAEARVFAAAGEGYPIVLKPLQSAATNGVELVHSAAESDAYFARRLGTTDMWGNSNEAFLAQEMLVGEEYMVDVVSVSGHHRVIEVWRADKSVVDGSRIYDLSALIAPDSPVWPVLTDYVTTVLDAFGISWGPTHTEVMLTESGPVLIELGARLHGGIAPGITLPVYGSNLALMTAAAYTAPDHFLAATEQPLPHRATLAQVALHCPRDGVLKADLDLREVRELPSFHSMRLKGAVGPVRKTRDLVSSFGSVYLAHPDAGQVHDDYQRIRDLEKNDLYAAIV